MDVIKRVRVIDSHTGGEPTRLVVEGVPHLHGRTLADMAIDFRLQHDSFRSSVINEPRGSDVMVGALMCETPEPGCVTGVIFFNNVGVLGMCGHGMIGVVKTLAFMGRIAVGVHRIDTPVGPVTVHLHDNHDVSITNVECYRKAKDLSVDVEGVGRVTGDLAWGGNWFYLVANHPFELQLANVDALTEYAWKVRQALNSQGYPEVDHVELFGPPSDPSNHSRNFVLCPGKAYDRSPCGTGTSAKVACLAADGKLNAGEVWRQESIIGSVFEASFQAAGDSTLPTVGLPTVVLPTIKGRAWVCGETDLLFDPTDPFREGISAA
jgi:4-hydroxyproline epimerase